MIYKNITHLPLHHIGSKGISNRVTDYLACPGCSSQVLPKQIIEHDGSFGCVNCAR